MEKVSLYYWAGAKAAAGVEVESVSASSVAEALRAVLEARADQRFPALSGVFVVGRRVAGPMILSGSCPAPFGWMCCPRSPVALVHFRAYGAELQIRPIV